MSALAQPATSQPERPKPTEDDLDPNEPHVAPAQPVHLDATVAEPSAVTAAALPSAPGAGPAVDDPEPEPPGTPVEVRRALGGARREDVLPVIGAALGGVSLAAIVYFAIAPFSGVLGFLVIVYVAFLGCYALLVSIDGDRELVKDRVAAVVSQSLGLAMLLALVLVVVFAIWEGRTVLMRGNFYTQDLSQAGPLDPLDQGGVLHAVVGTLVMMAISLALTVPLSLVCAMFLSETKGGLTRFVRTIVEAMTALPSVVAGLFVYAAIITLQSAIGKGERSGLAASIALSVMMMPIMVRAADVVLRLVPGNLKEAAAALGAPRWRVVWHVVLPTARSGLMTAIILGTARGIGETSPVLLTAGYTTGFNLDPLSGPMVSLPLLTFSLTKSPEPGYIARGFGAAAVLMLLVLVLFVTARLLGGRSPGDLSPRQRRARARLSAADQRRFHEGDLPDAAAPQLAAQGLVGAPAQAPASAQAPPSARPHARQTPDSPEVPQ